MSTRSSTEVLIGLYNVYQTALSYYTNVIWVFPAAFLTLNITAWTYLQGREHRWSLLVVALADVLFTQAFCKLVANERAIINVLKPLEARLRIRVGESIYSSRADEQHLPVFLGLVFVACAMRTMHYQSA